MTTITWARKPGASTAARERLLTVARELEQMVRHESPGDIRQLLLQAQQAAVEVFLDPAVPAMLDVPDDFGGFADVLGTGDRIASAVRLLASKNTPPADGPSVATWPSEISGGERLLHYRLLRSLGGGGMGDVLLAWDERLDRYVALKRLTEEQDTERGYRRLEREARAGARLRHAHVVTIYALEYVGDEPVLAQEYIPGEDLDVRIGRLSPEEAIRIAAEIATGIAAAHAAGILHRDLKPRNVRLRSDGTAAILDFGLGKAFLATPDDRTQLELTEEGVVVGTPAYMSPEQLTAGTLTGATDVFSFGVLFYELLTGRLPFVGETRPMLFAAILHSDPPPLGPIAGVGRHIEELVLACLQKDSRARPTSAQVVERLRGPAVIPPGLPAFPGASGKVWLVNQIAPQQAAISEHPDRHTAWVQLQRERARTGLDPHAITFEFDLIFDGAKPDVPIGQMKHFLQSVQLPDPDSRIGHVSEDERQKLHRGTSEVYATLSYGGTHAYWVASRDGRFFYLTTVPQLEHGTIPIEHLLGQTIECLMYASRYATMIARQHDAKLLLEIDLRNAGSHMIVGGDWSHRYTASLDALHKIAEETVRTAVAVSLPFLRDELPSAVKFVFDDLMTYFDFLTVPIDYYHYMFARAFPRLKNERQPSAT